MLPMAMAARPHGHVPGQDMHPVSGSGCFLDGLRPAEADPCDRVGREIQDYIVGHGIADSSDRV